MLFLSTLFGLDGFSVQYLNLISVLYFHHTKIVILIIKLLSYIYDMNIIEIVQQKANGLCVKEIAVRNNTNVRTIEKMIERKKKEFYCLSDCHLVATFIRRGLIQ